MIPNESSRFHQPISSSETNVLEDRRLATDRRDNGLEAFSLFFKEVSRLA
jgi:hypothetical protein